jgi:hypothetical protein
MCDGMKMQNTAMLIHVTAKAVPHFSLWIVCRDSAMILILLMMICIKSWISNTQKSKMKKKIGMLVPLDEEHPRSSN